MPRSRAATPGEPPAGFRISRDLPLGRHPLLAAFPDLDQLPTASRLVVDEVARTKLFDATCVEIVDQDAWMYVSPWKVPPGAGGQWKPVVTPEGADCIVIGESHLRESPPLTLFMDIFHEMCHLLQRARGLELWDRRYNYAQRPTEVEAYQFVVDEARRLKVGDAVLRDYLKVEWIDDTEFHQLLDAVGVPAE
ncbi:MAG: ImmA/IrrE family metallo-endopeptidase [Thermoplasmata archaeon]|nr:ImmA/IrrE family metallo-endopeptidase [Thermoplasmata archaeon]